MAEHIGCPLAPQMVVYVCLVLKHLLVLMCCLILLWPYVLTFDCLRAVICLSSKLLAMNSVETVYNAAWDSRLLLLYCSTVTEEGSLGQTLQWVEQCLDLS